MKRIAFTLASLFFPLLHSRYASKPSVSCFPVIEIDACTEGGGECKSLWSLPAFSFTAAATFQWNIVYCILYCTLDSRSTLPPMIFSLLPLICAFELALVREVRERVNVFCPYTREYEVDGVHLERPLAGVDNATNCTSSPDFNLGCFCWQKFASRHHS